MIPMCEQWVPGDESLHILPLFGDLTSDISHTNIRYTHINAAVIDEYKSILKFRRALCHDCHWYFPISVS